MSDFFISHASEFKALKRARIIMDEEKKDEGVDGVKPEDTTSTDEPTDKKATDDSEVVKTPEEKAEGLLNKDDPKDERILVDKDRFNKINDESKLYKTFAPIIDKAKDNPELVAKLLDTDTKGSLEDRVAQMEQERKTTRQNELRGAVTGAIARFKDFEKDWPRIQGQVTNFIDDGDTPEMAIRRSYLALHPEEAAEESTRIAQETVNVIGKHQSSGGQSPTIIDTTESPKLSDNERLVAKDLIGKDFGNGVVLFKSEEDYARLLGTHKDYMRAGGFYDLP